MVDADIGDCLQTALRAHEIGCASPYRLSFAAKGNSGASFGYMQGDLAAGQGEAKATFETCLGKAGFDPRDIASLLARLSVHCPSNPLTIEDTDRIDDALAASHDLVDKMDMGIFVKVRADVERCAAAAKAAGRTVTPEALIYIALWINMTGAPTSLLRWLKGGDPDLPGKAPKVPKIVDGAAITAYLSATKYYSHNPKNLKHLKECVAQGLAKYPKSK